MLRRILLGKSFKKILQFFRKVFKPRNSHHYHNIENGEKIVIDGKEFIKVKLKFVDTMNFNISKHVDNIESENELLKKDLFELKEQSEKNVLKIDQLQVCLKNMFYENTRLKEYNKKNKAVVKLNEKNSELNEIIERHKRSINSQENKIKELESENDLLKKELIELKEKSEQYILKMDKLQIYIKNLFNENLRLKDQNKKDATVLVLTAKISEQKRLIDTFEQKINDYENIINEIKSKNESL